MTDSSRTRFAALLALMIPAAAIGACTPQEAATAPEPQLTISSTPQQRSYLDAGPAPSRGAPSYVQAGMNSFARQTDAFGNDLVPRIP